MRKQKKYRNAFQRVSNKKATRNTIKKMLPRKDKVEVIVKKVLQEKAAQKNRKSLLTKKNIPYRSALEKVPYKKAAQTTVKNFFRKKTTIECSFKKIVQKCWPKPCC